jgi:hypothetical protein
MPPPFEPLRLEALRAADDAAVQVVQRPPGIRAQIEGQNRRVHVFSPFLLLV